MDANVNGKMRSGKRKPLADITGEHNLIPTSALRKLVAASSSSSSISKPLKSNLRSNSNFRNQISCSGSENRSETSIGSSNISGTGGSKTVEFRTPSCAVPKGDVGLRDAVYHTRETIKKSNKEIETGIVNVIPTSLEKKRRKSIVVPAILPHSTNTKVNGNAISDPCCSPEKEKQSAEVNFSLSGGHGKKEMDIWEEIRIPANCTYQRTVKGKTIHSETGYSIGKTEAVEKVTEKSIDKKKRLLKPLCSSIERSRVVGKEIPDSSRLLVGKTKDKGNVILHPPDTVAMTKHVGGEVNCPPPRNKPEMNKNYALTSSCPAMPRTKKYQNSNLCEAGSSASPKSWTDPHPTIKKERSSRLNSCSEFPLDIQQQKAYFEEVDAFELPEEEVSEDESS